jgi:hypothetical protein
MLKNAFAAEQLTDKFWAIFISLNQLNYYAIGIVFTDDSKRFPNIGERQKSSVTRFSFHVVISLFQTFIRNSSPYLNSVITFRNNKTNKEVMWLSRRLLKSSVLEHVERNTLLLCKFGIDSFQTVIKQSTTVLKIAAKVPSTRHYIWDFWLTQFSCDRKTKTFPVSIGLLYSLPIM